MSLCRTCLSRKDLKPIFPDKNHASTWSLQLYLLTGVKIQPNDGLTQLICLSCLYLIKISIHLRKLSLESEEVLKKAKSIKKMSNQKKEIDNKVTTHLKNETKISNSKLELLNNNYTNQNNQKNKRKSLRMNKKKIKHWKKELNAIGFGHNKSNLNYHYSVRIEDFESSNDEDFMNEDIVDLGSDSGISKKIRIEDYESSDSLELEGLTCESEDDMVNQLSDSVKAKEMEFIERERKKCISKEQEHKLMSLAVTPYDRFGPIKCSLCDKVLRSIQNFKCHAKTHFELENSCEECGKKFVNRSHMRYHQQRLHGRTKRLACAQCSYRAVDLQALQNHERAEHTGERPYVCDVCGVSFRMRANIVQHMRKHFGVRNSQCDRCPAMFRSRSELWGHQTKVHFMVYTYQCYLCSDTYKSPAPVKKHLVNVHGVPVEQQLQITCVKTRRRSCDNNDATSK